MRVFFGCTIEADWPSEFPAGQLLNDDNRHLTLVFIGQISQSQLALLKQAPKPDFEQMPNGYFENLLPLPARKPSALTYHAQFTKGAQALFDYQQTLLHWCQQQGFPVDDRAYLPHVTLARQPFDLAQWQSQFQPLPFRITGVYLYQSLGQRQYHRLHQLA